MDKKLRKILAESIRDIETGVLDVEGCLRRYADRAAELRPHLELWNGLNTTAKAQPGLGAQQRGQQQMLAALSEMEASGKRRMIPFLTPAIAKAAGVIAAVALLAIGAAGASAAFGGPDIADEVLTAVGITNADERCDNSTQGRGNASENAANAEGDPNARASEGGADGQPSTNANPRSGDRCFNADAAGNDTPSPNENANSNAADGADNAEDQRGNADGATDSVPDDVPPDSVP